VTLRNGCQFKQITHQLASIHFPLYIIIVIKKRLHQTFGMEMLFPKSCLYSNHFIFLTLLFEVFISIIHIIHIIRSSLILDSQLRIQRLQLQALSRHREYTADNGCRTCIHLCRSLKHFRKVIVHSSGNSPVLTGT